MKKALLLLLTAFSFQLIQAQVGIGTKTPNPSAMLEVKATNRGVLIPRLTMTQRNAIKSPANSLLIYQTDNTPGYYYFASGVWTRLATGTGSGTGPTYTFASPLLLTGTNVNLPQAGVSSNGYLSSVDWNTFNNKLSTASAASTYAPIASPTFTGTVSGVTKSMVGLGNVDNTSDLTKPISSLTQAALDGKASLSSPGFSGTPTAPTPTVGNNSTQIATTAFVNAAISTISTPDADASTKGKIQLAGDLSGSAAQPTIAAGSVTSSKIADGSITDSKVANGISKSKVGLDQVDNTSDLNKPISTAAQLALDGKISSNAAITAGTKTKVSYDGKGLIIAGEDATTSDIAEGSNLYYTDSRARSSISFTTNGNTGAPTYNNQTGVLNIPMPTNQIYSLDYPEGINGEFVFLELSKLKSYTVPQGYNFYVTGESDYSVVSVNRVNYAKYVKGFFSTVGLVFGENAEITAEATGDIVTDNKYLISGVIVPKTNNIIIINEMITAANPYVVPAGKKLVLKGVCGFDFKVNGITVKWGVNSNYCLPSGTIISSDTGISLIGSNYPSGVTGINGYLINN